VRLHGRTAWLSVVVAAACADTNNLSGGIDLSDAGPGKPRDAGTTPFGDGGGPIVPSGRCDPQKPFGAPAPVTELDAEANFTKSAVLSPDELEVFFLRYTGNGGEWDLRHARRTTKDDPWGGPVTDPMSPGAQGFLSLTAAGKKLYFWNGAHPYRATRSSTLEAFGSPPGEFDVANGPWPFVVAADDVGYCYKFGDGDLEKFIHRGSINGTIYSLATTPVPNIHVAGYSDNRPVLNESETALYFGSNRPGGQGLDDVWVARRASKQEEFGPAVIVRELSSDEPDYVTWIADDDCVAYLDHASHIYAAKRPP
jgi:hypothetical protein